MRTTSVAFAVAIFAAACGTTPPSHDAACAQLSAALYIVVAAARRVTGIEIVKSVAMRFLIAAQKKNVRVLEVALPAVSPPPQRDLKRMLGYSSTENVGIELAAPEAQ
jgi:hypothetical protein